MRTVHRGHNPRAYLAIALLCLINGGRVAAQDLPTRLADSTFWRMITDMSEPGGYFRSDNLVGNEAALQYVIPELLKTTKPGGVYLGVAPDQNFTYIVALKSKMAFMVDIRRGNMHEHMIYKALIEMSADRADFLSKLFSRKRPPGLDTNSTVDALMLAYARVDPDSNMYNATFAAIKDHLLKDHGFGLTAEDIKGLDYVFGAFYDGGPYLSYNYPNSGGGRGGFGGRGMPTYQTMMTENDGQGLQRSYLASEANYRALKAMETNNLIVPLTGDFSGPKALRAVGEYLRAHHAIVTAFYTSNVEQYLFQQGDEWSRFYNNVATLPIDSTSTFIRSYSARGGGAFRMQSPNGNSSQLLCPIADLLKAFNAGRVQQYFDVIQISH